MKYFHKIGANENTLNSTAMSSLHGHCVCTKERGVYLRFSEL